MFRTANYVDNNCLRCGKTVYPTDKIGKNKKEIVYTILPCRKIQAKPIIFYCIHIENHGYDFKSQFFLHFNIVNSYKIHLTKLKNT